MRWGVVWTSSGASGPPVLLEWCFAPAGPGFVEGGQDAPLFLLGSCTLRRLMHCPSVACQHVHFVMHAAQAYVHDSCSMKIQTCSALQGPAYSCSGAVTTNSSECEVLGGLDCSQPVSYPGLLVLFHLFGCRNYKCSMQCNGERRAARVLCMPKLSLLPPRPLRELPRELLDFVHERRRAESSASPPV